MRKLAIALGAAAVLLVSGGLTSKAQTMTLGSPERFVPGARNFRPIEKAACRGWGPHCGPGHHWVCGPHGHCWCARC
jgi:hypothetical protein